MTEETFCKEFKRDKKREFGCFYCEFYENSREKQPCCWCSRGVAVNIDIKDRFKLKKNPCDGCNRYCSGCTILQNREVETDE